MRPERVLIMFGVPQMCAGGCLPWGGGGSSQLVLKRLKTHEHTHSAHSLPLMGLSPRQQMKLVAQQQDPASPIPPMAISAPWEL